MNSKFYCGDVVCFKFEGKGTYYGEIIRIEQSLDVFFYDIRVGGGAHNATKINKADIYHVTQNMITGKFINQEMSQ